jgi:fused signal recognition particle receptor
MLKPVEQPLTIPAGLGKPFVILMVGVNGVGKTTTIGKLAKRFQSEGCSVMLAAGDTFRAAAVEQLQAWGERNKVPVVAQHTGADSASVIFDAYQSAVARGIDVLIADTAGRLHNKSNLMQELEKVVRVLKKLDPDVPQETLLVLDATTGQNALSQARAFTNAVQVSGLVLSKLDGTAKGGMVFAIAGELGLPLRFIGIGEKAEDLRPFAAAPFVDALFASDAE